MSVLKKEYRTKFKDDIMEYLRTNKDVRFCASDVFEYMSGNGVTINLTTVYRNLDKMTENGILLKSKNPTDECCYYQYTEPNSHCKEHLHVQCKMCGKIIHLEGTFMKEFNDYIVSEHGFALDFKDSMIIGICKDCK